MERLTQQEQPDLLGLPPDQRRAEVREAFEAVYDNSNLTPEQRQALELVQRIYERAEAAKRDTYDRAPTEGQGGGLEVVLPLPLPVPPAAAGAPPLQPGKSPAGDGAPGYDPKTDTYSAGSPPLQLPSLDNLGTGVPPSVRLIYGMVQNIVTMASGGGRTPDREGTTDGGERTFNGSKQDSEIWNDFENVGGGRKKSGTGSSTRYYEWDYTHNDIEVYDRKGKHLGSMDPNSGEI